MKCANCDNEALYVYQGESMWPIPYCVDCLPSFLRPQAKAGLLGITEAHTASRMSAVEALATAAYADPAEEPVEEPPVEDPKPKRVKKAVDPDPEPEAA